MFDPIRYFLNYFSAAKISRVNLERFAEDLLATLAARNEDGANDALIALMQPILKDFVTGRAAVIDTQNTQVGETGETDAYLHYIGETMKNKRDAISVALSGRTTKEYHEIFPGDKLEYYTRITKRDAPARLKALAEAADRNSEALGAELTTLLQSFETGFGKERGEQQAQMGANTGNRQTRDASRDALETALQTAVLEIALRYVKEDNPELGMSYFKWHLLWPGGVRPGTSGEEGNEPQA